jgi:hypothetical protein
LHHCLKQLEKDNSYQPSAISRQPSAISRQPSAVSHQLSAISYQLSAKIKTQNKKLKFECLRYPCLPAGKSRSPRQPTQITLKLNADL